MPDLRKALDEALVDHIKHLFSVMVTNLTDDGGGSVALDKASTLFQRGLSRALRVHANATLIISKQQPPGD